MVNVIPFETPPPGVGLNTVTVAVPAVTMSDANIAAVNLVALTYVVTRSDPFHLTTDPLTKLEPFAVSVNAFPPAVAFDGLRLVRFGTGFTATIAKFAVTLLGADIVTVAGFADPVRSPLQLEKL